MLEPERRMARGVDRWLDSIVSSIAGEDDATAFDVQELWSVLDNLPVAVLLATDRCCARIVGNMAAQRMLKVPSGANMSQSAPPDELPSFSVFRDGRRIPPEQLPLQLAAATGEPVAQSECEVRFLDGETIVLAGHCIPLRNRNGELCGSIGAFVDVSPRMSELSRAQVISREMSHRAKNTISLVQAVAKMTIRRHLDADTFRNFDDRLMSIAQFQDLASTNRWESMGLEELCRAVVIPVVGQLSQRVTICGPVVDLDPAVGSAMAMFLHELTTNACKHGALSESGGRVDLSWTVERGQDDARVDLLWKEVDGPPVVKPKGAGFGTKLIDMLVWELPEGDVDIAFEPNGVQARIQFQIA